MTEFKHETGHSGFVTYSPALDEATVTQLKQTFETLTTPLCIVPASESDFERLRGMANHGTHLITQVGRLMPSAFKGAYDTRTLSFEDKMLLVLGSAPKLAADTAIGFTVCNGCLASALAHCEELAELIRDVQEYVRRNTPA